MNKKYLFIVGLPRSGTTGFTKLLNSNHNICIGLERYKYIKQKQLNFNESLFNKDNFFKISKDQTNISNEKMYNRLKIKFDSAKYIGDKIPNLYFKIHKIVNNFKNSTFFCMIRNPINVAMSWDKRANNPLDIWPNKNNHDVFIEHLNNFYNYYNEHIKNKNIQIYFINFDFLESEYKIALNYYTKILELLEIDIDHKTLKNFKNFHEKQISLTKIRNDYFNQNKLLVSKIKKDFDNLEFDFSKFFKKIFF